MNLNQRIKIEILKKIMQKTDALERLKDQQLQEYKIQLDLEEENITPESETIELKKPSQIKEELDNFIVGQDKAKKDFYVKSEK